MAQPLNWNSVNFYVSPGEKSCHFGQQLCVIESVDLPSGKRLFGKAVPFESSCAEFLFQVNPDVHSVTPLQLF